MEWKRILNPWAALREAETTVAVLQDRLEDAYRIADEAEAKAFRRAADHYWQRNRMVEAQLEQQMKQMADLASLTPLSVTILQTKDE